MPSAAQDLLERPSLRELIHQLVEVPDPLHERVLDRLDAHPADGPGDERCVRVQARAGKEVSERRSGGEVPLQLGLVVPGEPADDGVELVLRATLLLDLREVQGVDPGDGHAGDPLHCRRAHPDVTANQRPSGSENAKLGLPACSPGFSFISSSGTSSNANGWSANPTCAIAKVPATWRRFSTMPTCSTQNLRHASASFTWSTTYPTFMRDSREAAAAPTRRTVSDLEEPTARR